MNKKLAIGMIATVLTSLMSASVIFAGDVTVTAPVTAYLTATFQYSSITYSSLTSPSTNNIAPNQANGVYNVTIDTNSNFSVSANGTNFTSNGYTFGIGNLTMDSDTNKANLAVDNGNALTGNSEIIDTDIDYTTTTHYHGFWLSVPSAQYATSYSSSVTVTYASV